MQVDACIDRTDEACCHLDHVVSDNELLGRALIV